MTKLLFQGGVLDGVYRDIPYGTWHYRVPVSNDNTFSLIDISLPYSIQEYERRTYVTKRHERIDIMVLVK
jgi:hypothetical protein